MRPKPKVFDWLDTLELSHDRHLMLLWIDREHPDDPPLLLEEYDSSQELDDLSHGGNIRLYPEDLPRLIAWLEQCEPPRVCRRLGELSVVSSA